MRSSCACVGCQERAPRKAEGRLSALRCVTLLSPRCSAPCPYTTAAGAPALTGFRSYVTTLAPSSAMARVRGTRGSTPAGGRGGCCGRPSA